MSESLKALFENLSEIIDAAAQSPMALLALVAIAITFVAVIFFLKSSQNYRMIVFLCILASGFLLTATILRPTIIPEIYQTPPQSDTTEASDLETPVPSSNRAYLKAFGFELGVNKLSEVLENQGLPASLASTVELYYPEHYMDGIYEWVGDVTPDHSYPQGLKFQLYFKSGVLSAIYAFFECESKSCQSRCDKNIKYFSSIIRDKLNREPDTFSINKSVGETTQRVNGNASWGTEWYYTTVKRTSISKYRGVAFTIRDTDVSEDYHSFEVSSGRTRDDANYGGSTPVACFTNFTMALAKS